MQIVIYGFKAVKRFTYGEKMYVIKKIINNNIVCSQDKNGEEIILRGLGIGFKKKAGDIVPSDKVEKIYRGEDSRNTNKMQQLFSEIPMEYVDACCEIVDMAENALGKKLNKNILITLTDHIDFAIERKRKSLEYKNALLLEIKNFYPVEFAIGINAVKMIKKKFNEELSEDEAGFIALHIVNAELNMDMGNMVNITEMIQAVTDIVRNYYGIEPDRESLDYSRFITHMKFFGQRVFQNKLAADDDMTFNRMIRERYREDYNCAVKIRGYISAKYNKIISEEEMIFLTVHLRRISRDVLKRDM